MIRSLVARAAGSAAFAQLVAMIERVDPGMRHFLAVLTYHRIGEAVPDLTPGMLSASVASFEEQMRFVATHCHPVSPMELLAAREGSHQMPRRSVLVTFDDAYRDFAANAWPILRRYGIPVILFVPTAYADGGSSAYWWDRLYSALDRTPRSVINDRSGRRASITTPSERLAVFSSTLRYLKSVPHVQAMQELDEIVDYLGEPDLPRLVMNWQELRGLAAEGVVLAPHTRTHPMLPWLSPAEVEAQILGSIEDLRREVGELPPVFAYPNGATSASVVRTAARCGINVAFTTRRGVNDLRHPSWLQLKRINVGTRSTEAMVRAQLLSVVALATSRT